MKRCGQISARTVCSEYPFIVYGHTSGFVGGGDNLDDARRVWASELGRCRERGRESDALIFHWSEDHWVMCGSLYDEQRCARGVLAVSF